MAEVKDPLLDVLASMDKRFGKGAVIVGDTVVQTERLKTGSLGLDIITGGGYGKGRMIEFYAKESAGKAQPLSSKILTPEGWKKMEDMEVGSVISTPDGNDSTVIGVYPQGKQDIYKITFDDKTYTKCTLDHLWSVKTRASDLEEVLSLKQIIKKGLVNVRGVRKFYIPTTFVVKFNEDMELPINPYLLGLILGDGGLTSGCVILTTADEEILTTVKNIISKEYNDLTLSEKRNKYDYRFKKIKTGHSKNELHNQLESLGLMGGYSYDKFIPEIYLRASIHQRKELLRGLMDSDGSSDETSMSYTTTSIKLSKDFEDLVRGLGMRCVTSSRKTKYINSAGLKVEGRISYRSSILMSSLKFNPFKLKRKADTVDVNKISTYSKRFIESIELVGREEAQCIAIGHPDKLYITDDYIVTHNTTCSIHAMIEAQKDSPDKRVAFIDAEHAFDRNYAEALGLDMSKVIISQPSSGEESLEIAEALIASGKISICVIDSVAALTPKAELEGEMGDSKMGLHARLMSQACRKLTAVVSKTDTVLFWINQTREKIGIVFGNPETTTGGNALKFYASTRIELSRSAGAKDSDGVVINSHVKAKTVKNKLAPPFQVTEFDIEFGKGIDKMSEIVLIGVNIGLIKKAGSWYSYGETKLGQGAEGVKELLRDNPDLAEELESKIREHFNI